MGEINIDMETITLYEWNQKWKNTGRAWIELEGLIMNLKVTTSVVLPKTVRE